MGVVNSDVIDAYVRKTTLLSLGLVDRRLFFLKFAPILGLGGSCATLLSCGREFYFREVFMHLFEQIAERSRGNRYDVSA